MENPAVQTGAEVGEAAPSMELAERLLQRRTEPLGVIDVRQGQRHYARTAGWVAQRFALLDHWKTRYGGDEDAAPANDSLVFASPGRPGVEPAHTLSNSIQLAQAVKRADAPQPGAAPAVSAALPEQFRIRRRSGAPASSLQDAASHEARLNSASSADGDKAASTISDSTEVVASSQTERGVFRAVEIPATTPHAAPAATDLILPRTPGFGVEAAPETAGESARGVEYPIHRKATSSPATIAQPGDLASGTGVLRQHSETPSATASAPVQTPIRVSRMETTPRELPLRLQRKSGEAATGLPVARELTATPAPPAITQMPLSDSSAHSLSETPSATASAPVQTPVRVSRMETTPDELPLRLQRKSGEAATGLPVARELTATPAIARMPLSDSSAYSLLESQSFAGGEGAVRAGADSITERTGPAGIGDSHPRGESPTSLPLIQRRAVGGAPQPALIWRRSVGRSSLSDGLTGGATGAVGSALPLAISAADGVAPRAARQASTTESTSSTSVESAAPAPPEPTASANEINVARLAEQVSRLLARQLAVERERRGRGGWR